MRTYSYANHLVQNGTAIVLALNMKDFSNCFRERSQNAMHMKNCANLSSDMLQSRRRKMLFVKKPRNSKTDVLNNRNELKNSFVYLSVYFWFHFIGFENGIICKRKMFKTVCSFILATISEVFSFLYVFIRVQHSYALTKNIGKVEIILVIGHTLEVTLRFLLIVHRKNISQFNAKLLNIHEIYSKRNFSGLKYKIFLILVFSDLITLFYVFLLIYSHISWLSSNKFYYVLFIIFNWQMMTLTVPALFCWFCFILNNIFQEMKNHLLRQDINMQKLNNDFDKTANLLILINKTLHNMLLITFFVLLSWIFQESYQLIFKRSNTDIENARVLCFMVSGVTRIVLMCMFSARVSNTASEVKELIIKRSSSITPFLYYLQNKTVGFTLLDTFCIGKSYIVTITGSLITYGMLIATFQFYIAECNS